MVAPHTPSETRRAPYATVNEALSASRLLTQRGFTFVGEDGTERTVTYADFADRASQVATHLLDRGYKPGEQIVLILPDNETFISLFFGAIWAGLIPVPIYPPLALGRLRGYLEHAGHIVRASEAVAVVTTKQIRPVLGTLRAECRSLRHVTNAEEFLVPTSSAPIASPSESDPCFIQFTSGSTSRPKGVVVTHGNLAANTLCIAGHGLQVDESDCGVSWLPLYHDMGLIGFVLAPLFYHQRIVSLAPLTFLKHPHRWLEAISRHRGTISFAPNFAYGLCTRRIKDRHLEGLDLSCWRVAGCGAEPIRYETMRAFAERFQGAGFREDALYPTYGMAEATLAVSFGPVGRGVVRDQVDVNALKKEHRATPPTSSDASSLEVVGCGRAFPDHEIAVVDDHGQPVAERMVGEVTVRGPSVTPGYMGDQSATRAAIHNGWLRTGDLGYMVEDELFVCGRKKELIIVGGKNYYPQDIEQAIWDVPSVRTGNVIAFGVPGGQGEDLVVALETRRGDTPQDEVKRAVRQRVSEQIGLKARDVVVLNPGSLPKTSSGKLQRRKTAELYLAEQLVDSPSRPSRLGLVRDVASSQLGYMRSYLADRIGITR